MKRSGFIKIITVIMTVSIIFSSFTFSSFANDSSAEESTTAETTTTATTEKDIEDTKKTLEQQKAELEQSLKDSEAKLSELAKKSKNTEEYINALDEKIGYLNEELTILDGEATSYQEDIDSLQKSIDTNQTEVDILQPEVDKVENELNALNEKFQAKYEAYCVRMRAMYISGNYNLLTALLTCGDISNFLTRYEMIKSVSKNDADLLAEIEEQTDAILKEEEELSDKKQVLDEKKEALNSEQDELVKKRDALNKTQEQMATKKATLSEDRAESDALFAKLTAENGMYTEYRNEDSAASDAVQKEISDLINGIITPDEATTATTGDHSGSADVVVNYDTVYSKSNAVLNMTYPVPSHYTVSCGFGKYSNGKPHYGIDFPCSVGSKVVAAQSGVVITVKRLDYSYGYYVMIYHGTDAQGRKIVTLYGHNSSILVSAGDTVKKGQQIAKSGSTGNSTGPHCHFEIRMNNTAVNPKNYLSK